MARTRASKVSDETKPAKKAAKKQAAAAEDAPATTRRSTQASKKAAAAAPVAKKKASKKPAAAAEAPAPAKAAKKKTTKALAPKPAAKKKTATAPAPAPASKKKTVKAPAPKPASTKKTAQAPASEQLAFSMDVDAPATSATSLPARTRPLQPGDRVPDFSLEADDGQTYSRKSLAGERFVIYFYPKDDTPGCTREACDFRDNRPRFEAASVKLLGVSGDSLERHGRFRSKYALNFPLLADPDRTVAHAFGAVGEKKLYGKVSVGIIRSTFVVGPDGVVEQTFSPVKVDGHAAAVLQALGSG
jgi:peroxiredoxin